MNRTSLLIILCPNLTKYFSNFKVHRAKRVVITTAICGEGLRVDDRRNFDSEMLFLHDLSEHNLEKQLTA